MQGVFRLKESEIFFVSKHSSLLHAAIERETLFNRETNRRTALFSDSPLHPSSCPAVVVKTEK